jgi:hypothetical protein
MEEKPAVTGPVVALHELLAPVRLNVGNPVGASDPVLPVIVAV